MSGSRIGVDPGANVGWIRWEGTCAARQDTVGAAGTSEGPSDKLQYRACAAGAPLPRC
jgi:hypothetical protein